MKLIAAAVLLVFIADTLAGAINPNIENEKTSNQSYADIYGPHLEHQKVVKTARLKCEAEQQVTDAAVEQHDKGQTSDEKLECFANCMFTKLGMFDGTNGFNVKRSVELFGQSLPSNSYLDVIREKTKKCDSAKLESESKCAWANRSFQCFIEEGLSLG